MEIISSGPRRRPSDDGARGAGSVRERIQALVEPMPLPAVQELFNRIEPDGNYDPNSLTAVKAAFIEHLNKFRPQRARRLFTELFVPIWTGDAVLPRARRPIPGAVHRIDVAALWRLLSGFMLAEIADRAQIEIDRLAQTLLINDALQTPEARALGDEMRRTTVQTLDDVLAGTVNSRMFLEAFNKQRQAETRTLGGGFDTIVTLDRPFLQFVREYLAALPACAAALAASAPRPQAARRPSEAESEEEALALLEASERLGDMLSQIAVRSELPFLLPLTQLNVRRRYTTAALYIREIGAGPRGGPLTDALLGHFEASCRALKGILDSALRLDERAPGASIRITRRERATLDDTLSRLDELIAALMLAGVVENRVTAPQFALVWHELIAFITNRLAIVADQRSVVAFAARAQAVHDHQDVVWLVRMIWALHTLGRRYELGDQAFFGKWRTRLMDELKGAVDRAARVEPGETLGERMEHLLRLNEFAGAVGQKISPFLSVTSPNIVRMIADSMLGTEPLDPARRTLVDDFIIRVREELRRSKRWQSPDLTNLVELAEAQGL